MSGTPYQKFDGVSTIRRLLVGRTLMVSIRNRFGDGVGDEGARGREIWNRSKIDLVMEVWLMNSLEGERKREELSDVPNKGILYVTTSEKTIGGEDDRRRRRVPRSGEATHHSSVSLSIWDHDTARRPLFLFICAARRRQLMAGGACDEKFLGTEPPRDRTIDSHPARSNGHEHRPPTLTYVRAREGWGELIKKGALKTKKSGDFNKLNQRNRKKTDLDARFLGLYEASLIPVESL
ncbi:hypothetical protein ACLOJK_033568 [Asimina triloba]